METKAFKIRLNDFIDTNWYENIEDSSVWLRIYAPLYVTLSKISQDFKNAIHHLFIGTQPVKITYLSLAEPITLHTIEQGFLFSDLYNENKVKINPKVTNKELPQTSYIIFSSPYRIDGKQGNEGGIIAKFNIIESILSAYIGNNLLKSLAYEVEFSLSQKGQPINGPAIETPSHDDGPFLSIHNWQEASDTFHALETLKNDNQRNKINLALRFFQKGKATFNDDESFFLYWTAIMVLTEGKGTQYINKILQGIYGYDSREVENNLKWMWAINKRNKIFKQGAFVNFDILVERYFQLLFLEILRKEPGLPSKKYLLNYIKSAPIIFEE
jgi:hypothetical protein